MKLVPRTKRDPGVTWMRPFGPMISANVSHSHTPGFSRTKCFMKLCTVRLVLFPVVSIQDPLGRLVDMPAQYFAVEGLEVRDQRMKVGVVPHALQL